MCDSCVPLFCGPAERVDNDCLAFFLVVQLIIEHRSFDSSSLDMKDENRRTVAAFSCPPTSNYPHMVEIHCQVNYAAAY